MLIKSLPSDQSPDTYDLIIFKSVPLMLTCWLRHPSLFSSLPWSPLSSPNSGVASCTPLQKEAGTSSPLRANPPDIAHNLLWECRPMTGWVGLELWSVEGEQQRRWHSPLWPDITHQRGLDKPLSPHRLWCLTVWLICRYLPVYPSSVQASGEKEL